MPLISPRLSNIVVAQPVFADFYFCFVRLEYVPLYRITGISCFRVSVTPRRSPSSPVSFAAWPGTVSTDGFPALFASRG